MTTLDENIGTPESFYQLITENCHDLIAVLRLKYIYFLRIPKFEFEYINETTHKRVLGYNNEDLIGKPLIKIIHSNSYRYALNAFLNILKNKEGSLTAQIYKKDGMYLWVETRGRVFKDSHGIEKILIISREITESKIKEQKLKEAEAKYRIITENAHDMIAIFNRNNEYEYINEAPHQRILGYLKEELIGTSIVALIHPNDLKTVETSVKRGFLSGKENMELQIRHKDGHYIWVEARANFFTDEEGQRKSIVITREISERKQKDEALKKSEERYRQIIENAHEGIWIIDEYTNTSYVNQQMVDILGYESPNEFIGRSLLSLLTEEQKRLVEYYISRRKRGLKETVEFGIITPKGKRIFLNIKTSPIFDDQGDYKGALSLISDISHQKQAERQLKESEEQFKLIAEQLLMGILIIQDGVVKYVNEAGSKIGEYSIDEIRSWQPNGFSRLIHSDDKEFVMEQAKIKQQGLPGAVAHYIMRVLTKFGKLKWVSLFSKTIHFQGRLADLVTLIDITDQKKAEEDLRKSEEKFKMIAEQSIMGIIIQQEGKIKYMNEAISTISGYSPAEVISWVAEKYLEVVHPENVDFVREESEKRKRGEVSGLMPYNIKIVTKSGDIKWVSVYSKPIVYQEQSANLITIVDITEQKSVEEKLRESEEKYRFITENMDDIIAILDGKLNVEYVNEAIQRFSGFSIEQSISQSVLKFIHPEDLERALKLVDEGKQKGAAHGEIRVRRKDGSYIWIEVRGKVIFDNNNAQKFIIVNRDIDARKRLEQYLKESEELYRSLIKATPDAITVTDLKGKIIDSSEKTLELHGFGSMDELIGRSAFDLIDLKDHKRALENLQKTLTQDVIGPVEYSLLRKDGSSFLGELKAALVRGADGNPRSFIATARDVTEQRLAEKQLSESEEKYRNAYNRAEFYKDLLSHDISNILQSIMFSAESGLISMDNKAKVRLKLLEIKDQIKRSAKLISSVRKLSKLEKGEPILQVVEVQEVLTNVSNFIQQGVTEREIDIRVDSPIQKLYVHANELLRDVFENIMHNAVKYNTNNKVQINIRVGKVQKNENNYLKLEFMDNGIGIKDDSKRDIFERGFRQDGNVSGRGLGLSLTKKIIKSYNGDIWVENRVPGDSSRGSNFIILIPEVYSS
ncbi:MAG: PAS domain S-box protein [Promethearchaeota archaeon]|nr:MAG: PAS domain S-box protein [Candidatus Lokiarchaeota archaeon]